MAEIERERKMIKYLVVPKNTAEKIRQELIAKKLFAFEYPILPDKNNKQAIMLPIMLPINIETSVSAEIFGNEFKIIEAQTEKRRVHSGKLRDIFGKGTGAAEDTDGSGVGKRGKEGRWKEAGGKLSSFDIIGEVVIIEIPEDLKKPEIEAKISRNIMAMHPKVRSVYKKLGPMEGEYRVRKLELIAGEENPVTTYTESGTRMLLDVSKVYFSVRNSHERKRIASLVKPNENVLVFFAGVGPYALIIGKEHPDSKVVGIELNPVAVEYFRKNIALNKLTNVTVEDGDVRKIVSAKYAGWADRVVMPLPKSAHEFLDCAFLAVRPGGMVHFYSIISNEDEKGNERMMEIALSEAKKMTNEMTNEMKTGQKKTGQKIEIELKLCGWRKVKSYSTTEAEIVLDLAVAKYTV